MKLKTGIGLVALALSASTALVAQKAPDLKTEDQKTLYALGLFFARNAAPFNLTAAEVELVKAGFTDGAAGKKGQVDFETYAPKLQTLVQTRMAATAATEKKAGEVFLAKAAAEPGAKKLASGLIVKEMKAGTGAVPKPTDTVKVNYTGTLIDGTVFDSSVKRGQPAEFALNRVIKCWTEGVGTMKVGGKSKLVCPSDIAYGDAGSPPVIKPGSTLIFEVELLEAKATDEKAVSAPGAPPAAKPAPKK